MQPLIKYYNLESRSWEEVSELELNLKKYLLDQKNVRGLLQAPVEAIADAQSGEGSAETLDNIIYDSGEFDVLYKKSREISPRKWKLFKKNISERVGIELVVKGNPYDIVQLQEYLTKSRMDVVEARNVSKALLKFSTASVHEKAVQNYRDVIKEFITENYNKVSAKFKVEHNVVFPEGHQAGSTLTGIIKGDVEQVLELREFLLANGVGIGLGDDAVIFLHR